MRYNVTNIAKELDVTRQTIYYWIKKEWITTRRDYRNYPVFSDKDLAAIKKWHRALKTEASPVRQTNVKRPTHPPAAVPITWVEIQKAFYKQG